MDIQQIDEKAVFNIARRIADTTARDDYLAQACGDDNPAIQRIRELLRIHEQEQSFLESPAADIAATTDIWPISERPGTVVGPYKLLQQIGEGGMGVVFMAEQTEPIQRTVALKIIKPGMDTRQVIARFEAERQALALMDHPNIARVIDAGTTSTGRPYFVMELVKGVPITQYCDEKHLALRARLELLVPICQAVQHAHQKGLIHRDIKPSNVLVAEYDDQAVPKVIDFGVAKATAQKLTERTVFTEFGQVVGTVEYMSPEQAKLNQLDIDTRSDIYSLGVLLYELLTGSTPFGRKRLQEAAFDEMLRIIREEEPPKPSTRLSTAEGLPSIAANRSSEPLKLNRLVRGELDWVVMKALEKDRNRRYETANGFAADIQRYLNDEAVEACPPSATYRFRKFTSRHKFGVAAGLAVAIALVIGVAGTTGGMIWALSERKSAQASAAQATTEAERSEQVAQFLEDMLQSVGPSVALGRDTTMLREIVNKTAERIQTDLKNQPEVQIELGLTLAEVYFQLQEYKKMELTARQTLALARSHLGAESLPAAAALGRLGIALSVLRSLDEAETVTRQAIAMQRKLCGSDSVVEGDALCTLGNVLRHQATRVERPESEMKLNEAENALQAGLAMLRKCIGSDNDRVSAGLYLLSMTLMDAGKAAEAEDAIRESAAIRQRVHGDEYPSVQFGYMSHILLVRGKLDEAEACGRKALEIERKMGLEGKLSQVGAHFNLGGVLLAEGKTDEAETHYREGVRIARKVVDPEYRDLPGWLAGLAKVLRTNGKLAEARPLAEEAVAICDRHPDQVALWARDNAISTLRDVLSDLGDSAALEALTRTEKNHTQNEELNRSHANTEELMKNESRAPQGE